MYCCFPLSPKPGKVTRSNDVGGGPPHSPLPTLPPSPPYLQKGSRAPRPPRGVAPARARTTSPSPQGRGRGAPGGRLAELTGPSCFRLSVPFRFRVTKPTSDRGGLRTVRSFVRRPDFLAGFAHKRHLKFTSIFAEIKQLQDISLTASGKQMGGRSFFKFRSLGGRTWILFHFR